LIFTCCHPALSREARIALTLRVVCGLTTAQIAKAFLVPETTAAQRITRAKRKITDAGIPYRIPADDELGERLTEVLAVIYLLFNEGYLASGGDVAQHRDLVDDAEWLAALLDSLMPTEPEVTGLLALIRLHCARTAARFDPDGNLVRLRDQDRTRWDHDMITAATQLLDRAARHRRPGPYQLQAAIVACHAEARTWADTDWPQILVLYGMLLAHRRPRSPGCTAPSPCTTSPAPKPRSPSCPHWMENWTATTSTTPLAPRCCVNSAVLARHRPPTAVHWSLPPTRPSKPCYDNGSSTASRQPPAWSRRPAPPCRP
jgi:hypothetical protein